MVATAAIVVITLAQKVLGALPLIVQVTPLSAEDAAKAQLNALYNMDNLITTLATALLGGVGFFLANGHKAGHPSPSTARRLVVASAGFAALSLFLGYVLHLGLLDILVSNVWSEKFLAIVWVRNTQFYSFLVAVLLFGDFVFQNLNEGEGHENSGSPAGN